MIHKTTKTLPLAYDGYLLICSCGFRQLCEDFDECTAVEKDHLKDFPTIREHIDRVRSGKSTFIFHEDTAEFWTAITNQERKGYCPVIWKITPCERGITVFGLTKEEQNA